MKKMFLSQINYIKVEVADIKKLLQHLQERIDL